MLNYILFLYRFLKLGNANEYTGHCLRRTSSTLLVEAGATFETLKLHGKWKSTTVAEGYIAESMASKNRISRMIASSVTHSEKIQAESSSNTVCDEGGTTVNSAMDVNVPSTNSTMNLSEAATSQVLRIGSASFSGRFENCHFYCGKDFCK